jgi:hypothetical protein
VRATRGVGVNRLAKNDGSDPLPAAYSNVFARGGESVNLPGGLHHRSALCGTDGDRPEQRQLAWRCRWGNQALRNHPLLKGVTLPGGWGRRTTAAPW